MMTSAGAGCTQVQETYDYNNRLQPVRIQLGTSSNPAADYCLVYNYYAGTANPSLCTATPTQPTTGNNGNVAGYWHNDSVNTGVADTMTDTYDSLNRLGTAVAKNLSGTTLWSQTFTYDRYGNMSCSGSGLCTMMSYDTSKNRISLIGTTQTPSYDAAGNLTSDGTGTGTYSYTWNAEGRMAKATTPSGGTSTTSFIYNALGERVQLVAPTYTYNYPFDAFGQEIGIHNSSTGWGHYTVEMAGRRIFLSGSATRWLFHPNALGSSTMVTDQTGAVVQDATYYPWGQLWQSPGSFGGNWNFAAFGVIEPTTNLYPTPFRRYSSTQGRWLSPDPLAGSVFNPQSLNRYAYVLNRPTSLVDPLGLDNHGAPPCGPKPDQKPCPQPEPPSIFNADVGPPPSIMLPTSLGAPDMAIAEAQFDWNVNAIWD